MNILSVFDNSVVVERVSTGGAGRGDIVFLFPLTSRTSIVEAVEARYRAAGAEVRRLNSGRFVNESAERLRVPYLRFIARLPDSVPGGSLKEVFALDAQTSAWWFGLVAEKNSYKSDAFNALAQWDAALEAARREKVEAVDWGAAHSKMGSALRAAVRRRSVRFREVPRRSAYGWRVRARDFQGLFVLKHLVKAFLAAARAARRRLRMRTFLAPVARRAGGPPASLVIFTYFPSMDRAAAERGVFRNPYFGSLGESLEREGERIEWRAIYTPHNAFGFRESLELADRCRRNGARLEFLEEFDSWALQAKSLWTVLRLGLAFLRRRKAIEAAHEWEGYNIYPLLKDDWHASFLGATAYEGVHAYEVFRRVLEDENAPAALYPCEMHAWEKALLSARNRERPAMAMYGYQSATVSRMLLNYFNDPEETREDPRPYSLPRPEKFISDGRRAYECFRESGWTASRLSVGEAVRYAPLKGALGKSWSKRRAVLVASSISPEEASALLTVAREAFAGERDFEVWFKPHPFIGVDRVFELAGLSRAAAPFPLREGPVEEALAEARVVVVGESSVSIQALAYGCRVVAVETPEWINMSPLRSVETPLAETVNSPAGLRRAVERILSEPAQDTRSGGEARRLVEEFFSLPPEDDVPRDFMAALRPALAANRV